VDGSQAGSVIGKGGEIVKTIRESSGANVRILPVEELPPCADPTDRVVQCVPVPRHALAPPAVSLTLH
jgi:poly(rC)-binding protein 2/3/4